jgi:hypothetical protein
MDGPLIADTFVAGDTVSFVPGLFSKKYPGNFEVVSVKGKYVYIKVINNRSYMKMLVLKQLHSRNNGDISR